MMFVSSTPSATARHDETLGAVKTAVLRLLQYCLENHWIGFDPYDGLNSEVFARLPFVHNKPGRLLFIQLMKRSPINLRPIMQVPRTANPKGWALFSTALLRLSTLGWINGDAHIQLLNRLIGLRSSEKAYFCWGYNFDWQTRTILVPKNEPNIICTTFVGNTLLDFYEKYKDTCYLEMALSAGLFLLNGLKMTQDDDGLCFSYTSLRRDQVHNANLLGAAFLARLYALTGDVGFLDPATSAVRYSIRRQNPNGSWPYGESRTQAWIDNFHTGYNLVALTKFCHYTGNDQFGSSVAKGFHFYKNHFLTETGMPRYYHNGLYPIDAHSIAQTIVTLVELKGLDDHNLARAIAVYSWGIDNMQSSEGYFYYQRGRFVKNRISYMRWSQAWMLYALTVLAEALNSSGVSKPA
jgi:hypothetical protein